MSLLEPNNGETSLAAVMSRGSTDSGKSEKSRNSSAPIGSLPLPRSYSPSRPPTSAEIDAVIAAAMANAPPAPPPINDPMPEGINRSVTPLMTNFLPTAVGLDGRVNLFVGNLPYRVRWQDLKDLFRKAGTVLRADVSLGTDNRSRGYGTVLMGSREDAARAIDRFNGFTWQTRTLEVRPDRLPPEYEPQPHQHNPNHPVRQPVHNFHNMSGPGHSPYVLPSHLNPPHGGPWPTGQRPSSGMGQGMMALPLGAHPISLSPHPPQMSLSSSLPLPQSISPSLGEDLALPSLGQNGSPSTHMLGPSPLAGSLTIAGDGSEMQGPNLSHIRRGSNTPFSSSLTPDPGTVSLPRHPTSSLALNSISRPSSRAEQSRSDSPNRFDNHGNHGRAPPPGSLGPLPASMWAGVKALVSPDESVTSNGSGHLMHPLAPTTSNSKVVVPPPMPIAMEGLTHQGAHMGPPSTLHDRVVFVSNLPLSMQWQELKDLLRPAGIIIRADVATDPEGRPRGFGTALFATENDAGKAVAMFNGREIGGHVINVHLEREKHLELSHRSPEQMDRQDSLSSSNPARPDLSSLDTSYSSFENTPQTSGHNSPISARLPWSINTSFSNPSPHQTGRSQNTVTPPYPSTYRPPHPGPLAMPPFRPWDTPIGHPMSPQRGFPPMTPSMPGFVFQPHPQTPPVHPGYEYMAFSPGIPVTSPHAFHPNPYYNAAPGGPVSQGTSQRPAGSAALGTPTTQSFPPNASHGYGSSGPPGAPGQRRAQPPSDYFPAVSRPEDVPSPSDSSPTPFAALTSKVPIPTPSPLNAQDRLAPTNLNRLSMNGDDLIGPTEKLNLDDAGASRDPTTPPANGVDRSAAPTIDLTGADSAVITGKRLSAGILAENLPIGRMSMDEKRPSLGVWDPGERRASFGDIVAGRVKREERGST